MDLPALISQAVAEKIADTAFIEKEVRTRIDKLIVEGVDHAFRSYTGSGELIRKAVTDALQVQGLDLPSYGHIVTQMLREQIEGTVAGLVAGRLAADVEQLLSLAPKEIKLSEIAKEMLKRHDGEEQRNVITVIVDRDDRYSSTWLYLDEEEHMPDRDKYSCRHQLLIRQDGTIASATVDKRKPENTQQIGMEYGLAQRIRAFVACGTKIILDEEFVELGIGDY